MKIYVVTALELVPYSTLEDRKYFTSGELAEEEIKKPDWEEDGVLWGYRDYIETV